MPKIFTQVIDNCLQCPRSFRSTQGKLLCTKCDNINSNFILNEKEFPIFCPLLDKYVFKG